MEWNVDFDYCVGRVQRCISRLSAGSGEVDKSLFQSRDAVIAAWGIVRENQREKEVQIVTSAVP